MNPTAFITGITGQTGSYLAEQLIADGWSVHGLYRADDAETAAFRELAPDATLVQGDLADAERLGVVIDDIRPDTIFNLGGISSVAAAWENPGLTARVNAIAAGELLAAALALQKRIDRPVRFVQASTAEMFGHPDHNPQTEATPIAPTNPYGASKSYAHHLVGVYRGVGLEASSCILYNHESPRRPQNFVTRKITKGVAAIAAGQAETIVLGNLDARRDWGWAPDYARAIALAAETPGDYIVATGEAHSVRDFVDAAFRAAGIDDWVPLVEQDERYMRPSDAPELRGDASRAAAQLGWHPTVRFAELVARMVEHDLDQLSRP